MIKFIRIGDQINENRDEFAFYSTVAESFIEFDSLYIFLSRNDFAFHSAYSPMGKECANLIPEDVI